MVYVNVMLCLMITKCKQSTLYRPNITGKVKLTDKDLEQSASDYLTSAQVVAHKALEGVEIFAVMNL